MAIRAARYATASQSLLRQVCVRTKSAGATESSHTSQSLLRQVCVRTNQLRRMRGMMASQSLLRQVCVRTECRGRLRPRVGLNPFFVRSVFVLHFSTHASFFGRSQSLLRQVCVRTAILPGTSTGGGSQSLLRQVCVRTPPVLKIPFQRSGLRVFFDTSLLHPRLCSALLGSVARTLHQYSPRLAPASVGWRRLWTG